jgi:Tfp pilus assembly protein PilE
MELRHPAKPWRRCYSLAELAVVATLIAVLAACSLPMLSGVIEQARVDQAGARLQLVWTAQQLYWLKYRTYANSIAPLISEGLLPPSAGVGDGGLGFTYQVVSADASQFTVEAVPNGFPRWSGSLTMTGTGGVEGSVIKSDGTVLVPGG